MSPRLAVNTLLFALSAMAVFAAESERTELAAHLSEDASMLIDQLLGPGKGKVFVRVEGEKIENRKQIETQTPTPKEKADNAQPYPGYRGWVFMERTNEWLKRESEQSSHETGFVVKKLDVSLLLDDQLPQSQVEAVRKVVSDMLRVDTGRGDTLVVLRAPLFPGWKRLLWSPEIGGALVSQAGLLVAALMVCFVGYLAASKTVRALAEAMVRRGAAGPAALGTEMGRPGAALAGGGGGARLGGPPSMEFGEMGEPLDVSPEARFGFLTSRPPREVARWLATEPPQDLAVLFGAVAGADPALGSRILAALPHQVQVEVSKALVKIQSVDPERLSVVEARVRARVEASMAGPDKLGTLLSRLPAEERTPLMDELSTADAQGSREMLKSLVTFEDLADLKVDELRRLVVALPIQLWSQALHDAPPAFSARVVELLPVGLRADLKEGIESPRPREQVLDARSTILTRAVQLAADGQITLKTSA